MPRYFALIPAAGTGSRMEQALPKQYLPLLGQPMIRHAVACFCRMNQITHTYVIVSPADNYWSTYDWSEFAGKLTVLPLGGKTRAETVYNGLSALEKEMEATDWVLVHDAARPCLREAHVERLINEVGEDENGGLLAIRVADTLKREGDAARVQSTESRDGLWQAQTPQMFRRADLERALHALGTDVPTDESRAMEFLGYRPKLVEADGFNFKVTYPGDLRMAEWVLGGYHAMGKQEGAA